MNLSFQEKGLWLMAGSLVVAYGFYFSHVLPNHGLSIQPEQLVLFAIAIGFLVITQVIGYTLLGIFDRRTEKDERDQLISLKGTRNGAYALATGVFFTLVAGVFQPGNFVVVHVLLLSWVIAQLVEIGSQLYHYRVGA
ncbi:MAG: hypothetical protein ACRC8S_01925 [Fimbriiglobus sp.]